MLLNVVYVCVLSRVQLLATPWAVTRQTPLSMEFPRQESWRGLPFPPPGDLHHPRVSFSRAGEFFTTSATWEARYLCYYLFNVSLGLPGGASQETQVRRVRSLGGEDPLEESMATHSSILV